MSECAGQVKMLKGIISAYLNQCTVFDTKYLSDDIVMSIKQSCEELHKYPLEEVNKELFANNILFNSKDSLEQSNNTIQLFYIHHIQIHMRMNLGIVFKTGEKDPLPNNYLNFIVKLLFNIRDFLAEFSSLSLLEYYTTYVINYYKSIVPLSMQYITLKIDGTNEVTNNEIIDQIIQQTQIELGPIRNQYTQQNTQPKKKETLQDLLNSNKKKRHALAPMGNFMTVTMK